jgi:hypothetical protein
VFYQLLCSTAGKTEFWSQNTYLFREATRLSERFISLLAQNLSLHKRQNVSRNGRSFRLFRCFTKWKKSMSPITLSGQCVWGGVCRSHNVNETSKFDLIPRRSLRLHQCHSKKGLWWVWGAASTVGTFAQVNGHLNIGEHLILINMLPRINN